MEVGHHVGNERSNVVMFAGKRRARLRLPLGDHAGPPARPGHQRVPGFHSSLDARRAARISCHRLHRIRLSGMSMIWDIQFNSGSNIKHSSNHTKMNSPIDYMNFLNRYTSETVARKKKY